MKLTADQISEVVITLTGEIDAWGDSGVDKMRLENQKVLEEVIDKLVYRIFKNRKYKERVEYSMKVIGEDAEEFFKYLVEEYDLGEFV